MNAPRMTAGALLVAGALLTFGCSTPKPEPEIASSAPQSGYAERYPADLQAAAADFGEREGAAKQIDGELAGYPGQLKDPKWAHVLEIVEQADAAGRSYDYVERVREVHGASGFFSEGKDEITKKVAGAAQYAARQKGCDVDVSGAAAHALKESVERELERYLRERNEAHRSIERYRASLGKENAAALEKQADSISLASYLVHIDLVERKVRMRRVIEELDAVKKSTDDAIAAERAFQGEAGRTEDEKKASEARIEALNKSKAQLDSAAEQAKGAAERLEERVAEAQKHHADAMQKLVAAIRQKGGMPAADTAEK
ncbi:MAG: hypothetical protein IT372_31570 [Polyangiaceae bacterium]|nr:hypothetical protein [Polyangiaceae bacterium]